MVGKASKRRRVQQEQLSVDSEKSFFSEAKSATATSEDGKQSMSISSLYESIVASIDNINNLVDLVGLLRENAAKAIQATDAENSDDEDDSSMATLKCIAALAGSFQQYSEYIHLSKQQLTSDALKDMHEFIHGQYKEFLKILMAVLQQGSYAIQVTALQTVMNMLKIQSEAMSTHHNKYTFPNALFERIVAALMHKERDQEDLIELFLEEFLVFDDLKYYTWKNISKFAEDAADNDAGSTSVLAVNIYGILFSLKCPATEDEITSIFATSLEPSKAVSQVRSHKNMFSSCWLNFLRLRLPKDVFKSVLTQIHEDVIPHLVNPKLLHDFLTDAYNIGGPISILALHGLFVLIHKHHLDYPNFFDKLYRLLDTNIFHAKHRANFFRLFRLFLTSTSLPAYLVAAFCKRLARLSLSAPPGGLLFIVRLIYNMLKRHSSCKVLIHHGLSDTGETPSYDSDPFVFEEDDPAKSHALESCLWELESIRKHYHPDVQKLVEILEIPALRKGEFDLDKVVESSYSTMFAKCLRQKRPEDDETAVTFTKPLALFDQQSFTSSWEI